MRTLNTSSGALVARSYDSNEEFSLHNWLNVCKLVEEADVCAVEELPHCAGYEAIPRKPVSEVKPATAYQHFAGNVV